MNLMKRIALAVTASMCLAAPANADNVATPYRRATTNTNIDQLCQYLSGDAVPHCDRQINKTLGIVSYGGRSILGNAVTAGDATKATANAALINAAVQAAAGTAVGVIELPCGDVYVASPIDNSVPGVLVTGCRRASWSDGGTNDSYGTRVIATAAMNTVLWHRTPASATSVKFKGGGFTNIMVEGNQFAQSDLIVQNVSYAKYDLYLHGAVGNAAAYFRAGVTGTDCAEACDIQHSSIDLTIREGDSPASAATWGLVLDGSMNANTSFNDIRIDAQVKNGTVLGLVNADNNDIHLVDGHRFAGGTGGLVSVNGTSSSNPFGGKQNVFYHVTGTPADGSPMAIYAQGTDTSGVTGGVYNIILQLDIGNATARPTQGTGSGWTYVDNVTNAVVNTNWPTSCSSLPTGATYNASGIVKVC